MSQLFFSVRMSVFFIFGAAVLVDVIPELYTRSRNKTPTQAGSDGH